MSTLTEAITNQYLSFILDDTDYAVTVDRVQSVLEVPEIIKVPNTPDFMRGIINLRGNVVPVIDLKLKFGLPATQLSVDSAIIVIEIKIDDEDVILGMLADEVNEVVEIPADQIEPAPRIGANINIEFIRGMGKKDDQFLIILNIDKIFSYVEIRESMKLKQPATEKKSGAEIKNG